MRSRISLRDILGSEMAIVRNSIMEFSSSVLSVVKKAFVPPC